MSSLDNQDVMHLLLNRAQVSRVMDEFHRVFGHKCFVTFMNTPLDKFDDFVYRYLPDFTFTEGEHIMTGIARLKAELEKLPTCAEVRSADLSSRRK